MAARIGIEVSQEVAKWYGRLGPRDRAYADRAFDRLAERGPGIRMPHARSLGDGLYELRFSCEGVSRRITYSLGRDGQARMLTTFAAHRGFERHEIDRAHRTLARTLGREHPTARERSR